MTPNTPVIFGVKISFDFDFLTPSLGFESRERLSEGFYLKKDNILLFELLKSEDWTISVLCALAIDANLITYCLFITYRTD